MGRCGGSFRAALSLSSLCSRSHLFAGKGNGPVSLLAFIIRPDELLMSRPKAKKPTFFTAAFTESQVGTPADPSTSAF
jgi:hypothetical protein